MPDTPADARTADPPWTLMYHAVAADEADPHRIQVTPELFRRQMAWLHRRRKRGVALATLLAASPDHRADLVGLTFDDGYADFANEAVPVLEEHGFTATVYVVAERLGGTNDWDTGPARRLMTAEQVRAVARRGMEIGSHTLTHARLPGLDDHALEREVRRSREVLDDVVGEPGSVMGFAYPYGALGPREIDAVVAAGYGHAAAVATGPTGGRFALRRTFVGQADVPWRLRAKRVRHGYRTRKAPA